MPLTIPHDPSLVLGNIVPKEKMARLEEIAKLQSEIEAQESGLNSSMELKRKLEMLQQEVASMGVNFPEISTLITETDNNIKASAKAYIEVRIANEKLITEKKKTLQLVNRVIESPVDYSNSYVLDMELATPSMKMDAQYFSFIEDQDRDNTISGIKNFVQNSSGELGTSVAQKTVDGVQKSLDNQLKNNNIAGTLIITAVCTHSHIRMLEPLRLDASKAINLWNRENSNNKLSIQSIEDAEKILAEEDKNNSEEIMLLSGASYGSSFVGMIHVIASEEFETIIETDIEKRKLLNNKINELLEISFKTGNLYTTSQINDELRKLNGNKNFLSHLTIFTTGFISPVKSSLVEANLKNISGSDPKETVKKLNVLDNVTAGETNTEEYAKTKIKMTNLINSVQNYEENSLINALSEIDKASNSSLDINTLIHAFTNYVNQANNSKIGVPINYYIKPITKKYLAELWIEKNIEEELKRFEDLKNSFGSLSKKSNK